MTNDKMDKERRIRVFLVILLKCCDLCVDKRAEGLEKVQELAVDEFKMYSGFTMRKALCRTFT